MSGTMSKYPFIYVTHQKPVAVVRWSTATVLALRPPPNLASCYKKCHFE